MPVVTAGGAGKANGYDIEAVVQWMHRTGRGLRMHVNPNPLVHTYAQAAIAAMANSVFEPCGAAERFVRLERIREALLALPEAELVDIHLDVQILDYLVGNRLEQSKENPGEDQSVGAVADLRGADA